MPLPQRIRFGVSPTPSPRRLLRCGQGGSQPSIYCPTANIFLARTSGLDTLHQDAIAALICGLVDDGIYTLFDVLYILATQNAITAVLNLISPTYDGINNGAHFVVDRGMTGGPGGSIDSQFNAATAVLPNFTQNSAHISLWSVIDIGGVNDGPMGVDEFVNGETEIHPLYGDVHTYYRINSQPISGVANTTAAGFYLANRANASEVKGYKNGVNVLTDSGATSTPVKNHNIPVCALFHITAGTLVPAAHQLAMASIGASLTPVQVATFYGRLRTYMTAVGVP